MITLKDIDWQFLRKEHPTYTRYKEDLQTMEDAYHGGRDWREGQYLKKYLSDSTTSGYQVTKNDKGEFTFSRTTSEGYNKTDALSESTFYAEKLKFVPTPNRCKLYVDQYVSIGWSKPPKRNIGSLPSTYEKLWKEFSEQNCDGNNNNLDEHFKKEDRLSHVAGMNWTAVMTFKDSPYPLFKTIKALKAPNWKYTQMGDGSRPLEFLTEEIYLVKEDNNSGIKSSSASGTNNTDIQRPATGNEYGAYRIYAKEFTYIAVRFEDKKAIPEEYVKANIGVGTVGKVDGRNVYHPDETLFVTEYKNDIDEINVCPLYNIKNDDNKPISSIGSAARHQMFIYNLIAEQYSALAFDIHGLTEVDAETMRMNNGEVGSYPGAMIVIPPTVRDDATGTTTKHGVELKNFANSNLPNLLAMIDQHINMMDQGAMIHTDELVRKSSSEVQIEKFDEKLEDFIRDKVNNIENHEKSLTRIWLKMIGLKEGLPEGYELTYNKVYGKKSITLQVKEVTSVVEGGIYVQETFSDTEEDSETGELTIVGEPVQVFDDETKESIILKMNALANSLTANN